ncbi:MAG TPA: SOS response-associated peptidase [Cyclobacteriaceae bacterium]|jgi:putative SOS response-associated peptidase YedK
MCYHKQDVALKDALIDRYRATMPFDYEPMFYENGFDFKASPILTSASPGVFQLCTWGLVPWWVKSMKEAESLRVRTLNAVSEEMFDKPAFRDAAADGKRCLIPCTGFFEWRWFNGGKTKYPYFVYLPEEPIFSIGGLWSTWTDRQTGEVLHTYTVLTTRANSLMEKIHNSKKRMPVIIPREYEHDWLGSRLTKDDVLALCQPIDSKLMDAYTISKMITDKRVEDKNQPEITRRFEYPELALLDG